MATCTTSATRSPPEVLYTVEAAVAALPSVPVRWAERAPRPLSVDGERGQAIDVLVCAVRA